jgi:replicative DNA helicase
VLGGTAGRGKTSLALQLAVQAAQGAAREPGAPVVIYSLEMPALMVLARMLGRLSGHSYRQVLLEGQRLYHPHSAYRLALEAVEAIAPRLHLIDRTQGPPTLEAMDQLARGLRERWGQPPLLVVDSLQAFPAGAQYKERLGELNALMADFRSLSDTTGAAILLISHQSRALAGQSSQQSLKGSSDIEYTADTVLLLVDPQEGKEREEPAGGEGETPAEIELELHLAKNRYGPRTKLGYSFQPQSGGFREAGSARASAGLQINGAAW